MEYFLINITSFVEAIIRTVCTKKKKKKKNQCHVTINHTAGGEKVTVVEPVYPFIFASTEIRIFAGYLAKFRYAPW